MTPDKPYRLLACSSTMDGGGSERQLWNLLRGIDREQWKLGLYLLYRQGPLLAQIPADVEIYDFWSRHQASRTILPGYYHRQQCLDLANILRSNGYQVLYERLFHMAMIAGPACRRTGVKHVASIVSPPANDVPRSEIKFAWLKRWFLSQAYRQATKLLAVSQGAASDAAKYYRIDRQRFEVIPNPVDLDRIDRLRKEPWLGKPLDIDAFHVAAIGRLSTEKGHADLIEAASIIRQKATIPIHLHLVGDGPLRDSLQIRAKALQMQDRIHFHGYLENPLSLLSRMQLFVLPSHYEGMPNVLLEAMACQIPTIATDCPGGVREVTLNGQLSQLVPVKDPTALADAVSSAFQNAASIRPQTQAARQHVEQNHRYDRWLAKMEGIFAECVK
jgi:glycosyltransferase involved in cell wall biosynthesis